MTSCQRPKECELSRYRHGSDRQNKSRLLPSITFVDHFLRLQHHPHSIHSLTFEARQLNRKS
jgi:hypothetical protein